MILNTRNLKLTYEKGKIRWIKAGSNEILRMIYPAVRDKNWGTIEAQIKDEKIITNKNSFSIKYKAIYKENDIHFEADYVIKGEENNTISYEMSGTAKSSFLRNRIGLCILHPIKECSGNSFEVISTEGVKTEHYFPAQISPHQPAKNISGINWRIKSIKASLKFEGDIFEMEDQRNWTDASYKTYSTPLDLPFPAKISKNERIYQKVTLTIIGAEPRPKKKNNLINIELEEVKQSFPNLGFSQSAEKELLTDTNIKLLKSLENFHYRGDIYFSNNDWENHYLLLHNESKKLKVALFLVLHFTVNWEKELEKFLTNTSSNKISPSYILLLDENLKITTSDLIKNALPFIRKNFPNTKIGGGVDANFAELNRSQLDPGKLDFVNFSISPQVHAFDDMSLIENLEGQKYTVDTAKKLFPGKLIFVSPITLKQRFNVIATTEGENKISTIDSRQTSFFKALWTLISIKYLSESGADLVTYFEAAGEKGLVDKKPFPVYHIFEMMKGARNVLKTNSSFPLKVDSICLEYKDKQTLYIVNFSSEIQTIIFPKEFLKSKRIDISEDFSKIEHALEGVSIKINPVSMIALQLML